MAVLVSIVTVLYFILASSLNAKVQPILFISMLACSGCTLLLIYLKRYELAKGIGLLCFILTIYVASATEDFRTGLHLHLITASVVAFVLYGYHHWPTALAFILFAFVLYLVCYFYGFPLMEKRVFQEEYIRLFFIINLSTCLTVSAYSIVLLSKLNHTSESELQKKEAQLNEKNNVLTKTNTELDRFVYSASHDLRAPLSSVLGLVNLAELATNKEELGQYLDMIKGRVVALDKLIQDIIDYSRNSRQELILEDTPIQSMVHSIIEDFRFSDDSKGIQFNITLPPSLIIQTDSRRLQIILSNLIANAIKYKDNRKEQSWVAVQHKEENDFNLITVSDNGVGIESSHKQKIFSMFFRGTEKSNGSGLGLYIASEAALKIGASISLNSEIGKGASFTVRIPKQLIIR